MVEIDPFPHIIQPGVLTADEVDLVREHWPADTNMEPEPGGLSRTWCDLVVNDRPSNDRLLDANNGFWRNFIAETLRPIYDSVHAAFGPLALGRFGHVPELRLQQLTLMQSEPSFTVHPAHKHYKFAPDWVFTALIQIDDAGNETRGSRLYTYPGMRSVIDGPPENQAAFACLQFPECEPALDIPFKPGQMVAISEGPWCLHGSTPGTGFGPRRIIRCHARIDREEVTRAYGCGPGVSFSELLERTAAGEIRTGQTIEALAQDFAAPDLWQLQFGQ